MKCKLCNIVNQAMSFDIEHYRRNNAAERVVKSVFRCKDRVEVDYRAGAEEFVVVSGENRHLKVELREREFLQAIKRTCDSRYRGNVSG